MTIGCLLEAVKNTSQSTACVFPFFLMEFAPLSIAAPSAGAHGFAAEKSGARFALDNALFSEKQFLAAFRICGNPCCPCGVIGFACQIDGAPDQTFRFDLDVFKRKLNTKVQAAHDGIALGQAVLAEAPPEVWQWLGNHFLAAKRNQMETMNPDTVDAQLPEEVLTGDSTMVGYPEIFPWTEMFEFTCDGKKWFVDDQYCVRPGCDCMQTALSFYRAPDAGHPPRGRQRCLLALFYDYRAGTFKVEKAKRGSPAGDLLLPALCDAYPEFKANLERRHEQLKRISRRLWPTSDLRSEEDFSVLPADEPFARESRLLASGLSSPKKVNAGRNDPCPCGSGRKFKRCCAAA